MSYRLVKVTALSPLYVNDFYSRHPGLEKQPYATQHQALMADAHVWANHLSLNLAPLGVRAEDIVASAEPMQKAWAREHGAQAEGMDLVAEQLKTMRPDVVFLHISYPHIGAYADMVRTALPNVRLVVGYLGVGYEPEFLAGFRKVDFMLTNYKGFRDTIRQGGAKAHHIFHGFEHTLLPRIQADNAYPEDDLLFAGSLVLSKTYHIERAQFLERLVLAGIAPTLRCQVVESQRPLPDAIKELVQPPLYGLNMLKALHRCRIGFNLHLTATGPHAVNVRLFEVTGVGSCLLTDRKDNLGELFEIGTEVVDYGSVEECAEKVRWLLDHPRERQAIADAGQRRTLRDHTFADRARWIDGLIRRYL